MKKRITLILMVVFVASIVMSCASKTQKVDVSDKEVKINKNLSVPEFYLNPPVTDDKFYGVGSGDLSKLDASRKIAIARARDDIAFQVSTSIKSSMTDYFQESGSNDDIQAISFAETISKQLAETTLTNVTTEKVVVSDDGKTVYALVSFPKANVMTEVEAAFERNEASAFADFKAQEALKRLEANIESNPPKAGQNAE